MTFPDGTAERLEATRSDLESAQTLKDAIDVLVEAFGSLDKLADYLGTGRGRLIEWKKGKPPRKKKFRVGLTTLGVPNRLLRASPPDEIERRLRAVDAEMAAIRKLLEE